MHQLLVDLLVGQGVNRNDIHLDAPVALPGSYRHNGRRWDAVVVESGIPIAAIDVVFTVGSLAKNLNNRMEEILGAAADFERSYGQDQTRSMKPCIGLIFVVEDTDMLVAPRATRPRIAFGEEVASLSLEEQLEKFFSRILRDGLYDAVCFAASNRPPESSLREPYPGLSFEAFEGRLRDGIERVRDARERGGHDAAQIGRLLAQRDDVDQILNGLISTREGLSAAEVAIIGHRRSLVAELRELALDPGSNETKMQAAIGSNYWLFGGQYVGIAKRSMIPMDQHDVPLIGADGSLHIVELKGPEAKLVRKHRNHLIVTDEVHEAVSQCLNYLRSIDEIGASLQTLYQNELGIHLDYRRARGTVLIGHPDRVADDSVSREQIEQTIRSYNAHLARIQVITYADLLDSAERALRFEDQQAGR